MNNISPLSIEKAPKDGSIILSDKGLVKWCKIAFSNNGMWVLCSSVGHILACEKKGVFTAMPTKWLPKPDWI